MKTFKWFVLAAALIIAMVGCGPAMQPKMGSIELTLAPTEGMKSILPPTGSMVVTSYVVTISEGPTTVEPFTTAASTASVGPLAAGHYHVVVAGKNNIGGGQIIGTSEVIGVDVTLGVITPVTITVAEISGTGTLDGVASWEAASITVPGIKGTYTPFGGTATNLGYVITGTSAAQDVVSLSSGWGTMIVQLFEGGSSGVLVAGGAEAVRIAKDRLTDYNLHYYPGAGTGIQINFALDFADPLILTFSLAPGRSSYYSFDAPFTIALTDDGTSETTSNIWYRNGVAFAVNAASIPIDPATAIPGDTNYSCVVFSPAGRRAGSASWSINVIVVTAAQRTLSGTINRALDGNTYGDLYVDVLNAGGTRIARTSKLSTAGTAPYSIPNLPLESVTLRAWIDVNESGEYEAGSDIKHLYWTAGGGSWTGPGTAITIPLTLGTETFLFTNTLSAP